MINAEIVKGALMCAVWVILLIGDLFLLAKIIKDGKASKLRLKQIRQEIDAIQKNRSITIETTFDDKSDFFKKFIMTFETINADFKESKLFITPDIAETILSEGVGKEIGEVGIGSFGTVNGIFFEVVGGSNAMYIARKIEMENMLNE